MIDEETLLPGALLAGPQSIRLIVAHVNHASAWSVCSWMIPALACDQPNIRCDRPSWLAGRCDPLCVAVRSA